MPQYEFSCCAFYAKCDYGKKECFFAESEPAKKEKCRCYQLKHSHSIQTKENSSTKEDESFKNKTLEQLSLF